MRRKKDFYEVVIGRNNQIVKFVTVSMFFINFVLVLFHGWIGFIYTTGNAKISIFFLGLMSLEVLFMGFEFWHLQFMDAVISLHSKLVSFNNQLCKSLLPLL